MVRYPFVEFRGRSVIVDDFDIRCAAVGEPEANPELIVDAKAVLSSAISLEEFEAIVRRDSKEGEMGCGVKLLQLSHRDFLKVDETPDAVPGKQSARVFTTERNDHGA
jgi:hypothetical protein